MSTASPLLSDKTRGRFDAFSDGVFAIVITLLVLAARGPVRTRQPSKRDGRIAVKTGV